MSEIEFRKRYGTFKTYQCLDFILKKFNSNPEMSKNQNLKLFKAYQGTFIAMSKIMNRLSSLLVYLILDSEKFETIKIKMPIIVDLFKRIKSMIDSSVKINQTDKIVYESKLESHNFECWQSELNKNLKGIIDFEDDIIFTVLSDLKEEWASLNALDTVEPKTIEKTNIQNQKLIQKIDNNKTRLDDLLNNMKSCPIKPFDLIEQVRRLKRQLIKTQDDLTQKLITSSEVEVNLDSCQKEYKMLEEEFISHKKLNTPIDHFDKKYKINRDTEDIELDFRKLSSCNEDDLKKLEIIVKSIYEEITYRSEKLDEWNSLCKLNFETFIWKQIIGIFFKSSSDELDDMDKKSLLKLLSNVTEDFVEDVVSIIESSKLSNEEKSSDTKHLIFSNYHKYRKKLFIDEYNHASKSMTFSSKYLNDFKKLKNFNTKDDCDTKKLNLLNLESNSRYLFKRHAITIENCKIYPEVRAFLTLPPKFYFSDLVALFTSANSELYQYFLEIDANFGGNFETFQTKALNDVVINMDDVFNTDHKDFSIRLSPNQIGNYLFKSVDEILNEVHEGNFSENKDLFSCFIDYFDIPQVQFVISLLGFLTCKLLLTMPLNEAIYETFIYKNNEIIVMNAELNQIREDKNELIQNLKKIQARKESIEMIISSSDVERESKEKEIADILNDIKRTNDEIDSKDVELEKLNELLKNEKNKEFQKLMDNLIKITIEFQMETDSILLKCIDDFNYNCSHLDEESDRPTDSFERKKFLFSEYHIHARECSSEALIHFWNQLCSFEIDEDIVRTQIKELNLSFEILETRLEFILENIVDADPFSRHFKRTINLLKIFITSLTNCNQNYARFKQCENINE